MKENIRKDVSTGFLSITDLVCVYNEKNTNCKLNINNIFKTQETIDRIYYLLFSNSVDYCEYIESVSSKGLLAYLKLNGLYKCIGRDKNKAVFAHLFIWCLIAQQADPEYFISTIDILQGQQNTYNFIIDDINYTDIIVYGGCPSETKKSTYLIIDTLSKQIKIGIANNLRKRFISLKTANPHIHYLYHIEGDFEKILHRAFSKYRESGEWFSIDDCRILKNTIIELTNLNESDISRLEDRLAFAIDRGYIKPTNEIVSAIKGN